MICDSTGKSRGQSSIPLSALTHPHNFYGLDWQRPIPDLEGMLWLVNVCSLTLEKSGDCIGNPCLWCWAWWGYWIKELLSSFYVSISSPRNTCSYPYAVIACKECLAGESRCHSAFLLLQSSHRVLTCLLSAASFRPAFTSLSSHLQPHTSGFFLGGSWYTGKSFWQLNHWESNPADDTW